VPHNLPQRFALVALVALLALAFRLGGAREAGLDATLSTVALDFRVVYCGAEALRDGADPYTVEPLRACEHRVGREPGEPEWAVTPLPLPGYAIALFVPLTLLPFVAAKLLWVTALALAFALASACVAAILRAPSLAVAAIFAPTIGFGINLHYGEPVPLAIAALCSAAYALERGAFLWAALLIAPAAVEPHLALPAFVALATLVPRSRAALAVVLLAGICLSLGALGFARNVEYFATLLPAQAAAELLARDQYSLSRYLALAGLSPATALVLGNLSYALATLAGVLIARDLSTRYARPAFVALFPPALAMLAGSFVHDVQIAAALPAAALLAAHSPFARAAIALLAVDWTQSWRSQAVPATVASGGTAGLAFGRRHGRGAIAWLVGAPLASLALLAALERVPDDELGRASVRNAARAVAPPGAVARLRADDSAARAWALRIALEPGWKDITAHDIADKVPLWLALIALVAAARSRERVPPVA
jgi:hypothetical protein